MFSTKTNTDIGDASRSTFTSEKICCAALLSSSFAILFCVCPQESEGGLYVCMNTFLGFGREHVERHYRKTGQSVYMHLKRHVKEVRPPPPRVSDCFHWHCLQLHHIYKVHEETMILKLQPMFYNNIINGIIH